MNEFRNVRNILLCLVSGQQTPHLKFPSHWFLWCKVKTWFETTKQDFPFPFLHDSGLVSFLCLVSNKCFCHRHFFQLNRDHSRCFRFVLLGNQEISSVNYFSAKKYPTKRLNCIRNPLFVRIWHTIFLPYTPLNRTEL